MDKQQFFLKHNSPLATFMMDMTLDGKAIIQKHVAYWTGLLNENIAKVFGPVLDPKGGYGVGSVDNEEHLKQIFANDPAKGLNQYEYYPIGAGFKQS